MSSHGLVRMPCVAGSFYPADKKDLEWVLSNYFDEVASLEKTKCLGLVLPHAGWFYCGDIIADALSRVKIPKTVILLGPHHTPYGAKYSIAAQDYWMLPNRKVAINSELADSLCKRTSEFKKDIEAHEEEHCIEVILPFIAHLSPSSSVVPIVLGHSSYGALDILSSAIAEILKQEGSNILIIASSDLNHFAQQAENERLDNLAISAILESNPRKLYDTCIKNQISMCGLIPTVVVMQALIKVHGSISSKLVAYHTSGKVSKRSDNVVGYAGIIFEN